MRIAVCDDCYEDALHLKFLLNGHEVRIYSETGRLLKDLEEQKLRYDLYLLDIYMEEAMNGVELAARVRGQDDEAVICFVSTSDAFYREAYDLYAVQYLLKPVGQEDVTRLLEKISRSLARDREQSLSFKSNGRTGSIPYGKILFIDSREHTVFIHCTDKTVQKCRGQLNEIAMQVSGSVFMRCHQSFLVNMYQVEHLSGNELVAAGQHIPVSRRYYPEIKKRYQEILFEEVY